MRISKAKTAAILAGVVIVALAVFSGVQTYRVHALNIRLASLASPAPAPAAHTERTAMGTRPVDKKPESAAAAKPPSPEEMAAAKEAEALLQRQRERVKQLNAGASGAGAPGTAGTSQPGVRAAADGTAKSSNSADKKTDKDAKSDQNKGKRATSSETQSVLTRAQGAVEKGSYDDAISILQEGLKADPTNRDLYRSLASLYGRLRRYDAELQTYADWSAQAPNESAPHYDQARVYAALGKSPEALQELDRFLQMTQGDMNAFPMVASVYRALGMSAEEGTTLQTWAQQAPDALDVKRMLADYYARTGDSQASLVEYQGIAQRVPEDADTHRNLAYAYRRLNMTEQAETELATAAQLQPRNMSTQLQLGDLYRQSQKYDAALQTYQGIIANAPNTPEAQQAQQMMTQVQRQIQAAAPPK